MEDVIQGWPDSKNQLPQDIKTYWMFRDDMTVLGGVVIKGKYIIILKALQQEMLKQLHINHMGIKKLTFQQTQPKGKIFIMTFQANYGK